MSCRFTNLLRPSGAVSGKGRSLLLFTALAIVGYYDLSNAVTEMPGGKRYEIRQRAFTVNQGQWPDSVLFRSDADGAAVWFTTSGMIYQLFREKSPDKALPAKPAELKQTPEIESRLVKASFIGANRHPVVTGERLIDYKCNYFLGNDTSRWRTDVPNYESITYTNLYDGVNLRFHGENGKLEYDFIITPGADLSRIAIAYEGARYISLNADGNLIIETDWGSFVEKAPYIYQESDGKRAEVSGAFELRGQNSFGFKLSGSYDSSRRLIIDPVLSFSTLLGGSGDDLCADMRINASGEAFICGITSSADFPVLSGYDNTFNSNDDIFLTKFNAPGNNIIFSTFLGGSNDDLSNAMTLFGDIFISGHTFSNDFPTVNPVDGSLNGAADVIVARIGAAGNTLSFSTYLGGNGGEAANDIVVRCQPPCLTPTLRIWIAGLTTSTDFPTLNYFDNTLSGDADAFLTLLSLTTLSGSITYSTYFGGDSSDYATGLVVKGNSPYYPYICGSTSSPDLPAVNAHDNTLSGSTDGFMAGFDIAGNGQLFLMVSTFIGGAEMNGVETANSMALNSNGDFIIGGIASSAGLATAGVFDNSYGGLIDALVSAYSGSNYSLLFRTYLGGTDQDVLYPFSSGSRNIAVDNQDNIYVIGTTESSDFPVVDPFDASLGGNGDSFAAKISPDGSNLLFCSYLGGSDYESSHAIAVDTFGCLYLSGITGSADFPVFNPYDGSLSAVDNFLTKICLPTFICGDANGNGAVNILDATFIIAYLYKNGPDPEPLDAADANGNGVVNILDATYLIAHLYKNGPAPVC